MLGSKLIIENLFCIKAKPKAIKFEGFEGILLDTPTTLAPSDASHSESQLPLNPVWPVTITVLLLKVFNKLFNFSNLD